MNFTNMSLWYKLAKVGCFAAFLIAFFLWVTHAALDKYIWMGLPISPNGPEGSVGFLLVFETAEAAKEAAGECPVIPLKEAEDG